VVNSKDRIKNKQKVAPGAMNKKEVVPASNEAAGEKVKPKKFEKDLCLQGDLIDGRFHIMRKLSQVR